MQHMPMTLNNEQYFPTEYYISRKLTIVVFKDFGSRRTRTRTCKLVLEDKDKDFPLGQQHLVTVKNGLQYLPIGMV